MSRWYHAAAATAANLASTVATAATAATTGTFFSLSFQGCFFLISFFFLPRRESSVGWLDVDTRAPLPSSLSLLVVGRQAETLRKTIDVEGQDDVDEEEGGRKGKDRKRKTGDYF